MKTALAALALLAVLIACLLATICCAENESRFQSLGGDFGRDVISTLKGAQTGAPANESGENQSGLWDWGNAPRGSLVQNGKLVTDPLNTWKSLNYTDGWIGQVEVDPFTGNPIYAYEIPGTGETKYFYIDPYTKEPIYVERSSTAGGANYAASSSASGSYKLPPVFS